ncbi:alcohol dehydrogenase catalytic domain-containing protein [Gilvimarinus chinensis]|uniref:alcohol dehydrogenase catalytic domain-containing protein n=1 Tax=Gilvimarinus chinensis TaxID=396005 RepID=UPI00037E22A3|nr:alcohol dehydrogenase catalytic domain-containing protein [Gilvimarinus chinensis]
MTEALTSAWTFQGKGVPLLLQQKAVPQPLAGQVLVKNTAIGINPVDWKFIQNDPRSWPVGHVPGVDGAGEIIAVGEGVSASLIGRRVAYHQSLGEQGSFAQTILLNAERFMVIPDGLPDESAAALPCPMLTAWQTYTKVPAAAGEKVLVTGMGAVNKILVQLLVQSGFEVHALSGSLSEDDARHLGIHTLHRHAPEDGDYYALFDASGSEHAASLVPLLQANGHVVSILGRIATPVDPAFTRTISYHEIALGALHDYGNSRQWQKLMRAGETLMQDIVNGSLILEPANTFSFNELPNALASNEHDKKKAVVRVAEH